MAPDADFGEKELATLALHLCAVWAKRAAAHNSKSMIQKNRVPAETPAPAIYYFTWNKHI